MLWYAQYGLAAIGIANEDGQRRFRMLRTERGRSRWRLARGRRRHWSSPSKIADACFFLFCFLDHPSPVSHMAGLKSSGSRDHLDRRQFHLLIVRTLRSHASISSSSLACSSPVRCVWLQHDTCRKGGSLGNFATTFLHHSERRVAHSERA